MKTFPDFHTGAPHDLLGALVFFSGLIAVVCVFWLQPLWTAATLTGAGLLPAVCHSTRRFCRHHVNAKESNR